MMRFLKTFGLYLSALAGSFFAAANAGDLLLQTNAAGDDVHVFNAETGDFIERIVVGPNPHGIAWARGDGTIYISLEQNNEKQGELLWVDKKTRQIKYRLRVGPEPHAIAVTPDGRWVYVPCKDGSYWIVDTIEKRVVKKIDTGGRPHNTTTSGNRAYLSPMGAPQKVTVVDAANEHIIIGDIAFSDSVRPPAIAPTLGLFFQHVDGLNGFEVADLENFQNIARVQHSTSLGIPLIPKLLGFLSFSGLSRCHGLTVRPGDREIWSVCGANLVIHNITSEGFPEIVRIKLPGKGYWLTFTPDGRHAFIALSRKGEVAMVDASSRESIRRLKAGRYPKRNIVVEYDSSGQTLE